MTGLPLCHPCLLPQLPCVCSGQVASVLPVSDSHCFPPEWLFLCAPKGLQTRRSVNSITSGT